MRLKFYNCKNLKYQKGIAAVWMGLLLVPIMGFSFWAIEGTRYVQETSRLRDATEAAAIAVTIEDQEHNANSLATQYIKSYVREIKDISLSADRLYQAENESLGISESIQYTVNADTTHYSWFASNFIPSFKEQQELAGRSVARKYPIYLGDNNIDIVFVSDFSGSMDDRWGTNRNKKIDDLKTAIDQISDKILCSKIVKKYIDGEWKDVCDDTEGNVAGDRLLNRVGFVPFNVRTREIASNNQANATSQLAYKNNYNVNLSPYNYNDVDWDYWSKYSEYQVLRCANSQSKCSNPKAENHKYAKRVKDVLNLSNWNVADVFRYVDFAASVSTMFTDKSGIKSNFYGVTGNELFDADGSSKSSQFYNIKLSNKLSDLNVIKSMWADGGTAAFQGILRGAQILHNGKPESADDDETQAYNEKVKMLLILSDGQESPNNGIFKELVDAGMCEKARAQIPGLYIGVIGIDFSASQQSGFQDCVEDPSEDIIDVSNLDELIEKIEELIRKGSKTSGITKLY